MADAVERWENRLSLIQEGDSNFICGEGRKVSLLRDILPEGLDKEVALRSSELGDSYEKTRAVIMKFAVQERIQHDRNMMDASELSGWTDECHEYSGGWYDGCSPWPQTDYNCGEFDLNAVAFGKAKCKGKSKGFQGKGYSNLCAKGQKGSQGEGKGK